MTALILIFSVASADDYAEARSFADFLQVHYDVTFLIGDECKTVITEGFEIGDDPSGYTPLRNLLHLETLEPALQVIDDCFAFYPQGFFSKFYCPQAKNGLRILVPNRLLYDGNTMAGVTTIQDGYINIFLGLGSFYTLNVHHELWHAMEYRIEFDDPDIFDSWSQLNPEGFEYSEDYFGMNIFDQAKAYDEWFVRGYSVISELEDRATVIEALFLFDDLWWDQYPKIKRKLDTLLSAVNPVFGNVYFID